MKTNMKKKIAFALSVLMLTAALPFTGSTEAHAKEKAEKAAIEAALKDAGYSEKDVTKIKVKYELEDGIYVYDVDFYVKGGKYSYDINAKTGEVVSKDFEKKKVVTKKKAQNFLSKSKAKSIVLQHAKVNAKDATFEKVKRDKENGVYVYDIEFHTDTTEYSYEINARTGKILEFSSEPFDGDEWDD